MKPAASSASRQARQAGSVVSTASGPSTLACVTRRRRGKSAGQLRVAAQPVVERGFVGTPHHGPGGHFGQDETGIRQTAGHGCHTDVGAAPHVHLAQRGEPADAFEIGADRPSPRPRGVPREPSSWNARLPE